MPEATLKAVADHEEFDEALQADSHVVLAAFAKAGINTDALAKQLLSEGVESFNKSWNELLDCIALKAKTFTVAPV